MKLFRTKYILMTALFFWLASSVSNAQFFSSSTEKLLPEEQAFEVLAHVDNNTVKVAWVIADGYYMYREQFMVESRDPNIKIGDLVIPEGVIENDPEFGEVEVYFFNAEISASIQGVPTNANGKLDLVIKGQGCNKPVGVCYPPQARNISVDYTPDSSLLTSPVGESSAQKTVQKEVTQESKTSFWGYVLAALFGGLLLSFTPCVLPMIPILLGIIAGQNNPSRLQSGWLAICYVFGTMTTYAIAGWVAGASGVQLQAYTQNPWIMGPVCIILIALAFSLFGLYKIQLPSSLQTKLNTTNVSSKSASITSYILGVISALVVGACVSPILILTLGAAISQGDPVLGASIMTAMALGMGTLLILVGFGAGWLLPKAGAWMNHVLVIFGFMVLGVAIYLSSNLNLFSTLYLWAGLLIFSGFYLFKVSDDVASALLSSFIKAIALITLLWGCLSLIGASLSDDDNVLSPLSGVALTGPAPSALSSTKTNGLPFQKTTKLSQVQDLLVSAKNTGKPVLIDFYADWCLDCKRMHRTTFKEASVAQALDGWDLIEIDVTDTSSDSEEVKQFFSVFGPPATLFFNAEGQEHDGLRQYGYMSEDVLIKLINKSGG